jgi:hypothetical protein
MKEGERLNLLKEVAGTKVYEQRREESLKIMEDTRTWAFFLFRGNPLSLDPRFLTKSSVISLSFFRF